MYDNLLAEEKEIIGIRRKRNHPYEYLKVHPEEQSKKEKEGWMLYKALKKEVKLRRFKEPNIRYVDELWVVLSTMGFTRMNKEQYLNIEYRDNGVMKNKAIDVLAVDNETVIVACCFVSKRIVKSNLVVEINEYIESSEGIRKVMRKHFPGKKICFILSTLNYQLSSVDAAIIAGSNLKYFNEKTVKYYGELAKHLGKSSRYQLLGNLFANTKIDGIPNKVPAIEGKMGGLTYYSFNIEPEKLLKFGYILHRNDANADLMPTYQRLIKKNRIVKIREFVKNGGFFPNSVVINIDQQKVKFDRASLQVDKSLSRIGVLSLPQKYRSAHIIDGQHRLYGYADTEYGSSNTIPVIAFVGLRKNDQVRLFMEINENQKTVPKNLQNTLNGNLLWESEDNNDRRKAIRLVLAQNLGEDIDSPLYDRIIIGENNATLTKCITLESINIGLAKSGLLNSYDKNNVLEKQGVLDLENNEATSKKLYELLIRTLGYLKSECYHEWDNGERQLGILTVNVGIYATIRVVSDLLAQGANEGRVKPKEDSVETLFMSIKVRLDYLTAYINSISDEDRKTIRKTYGGAGKVKAWRMFQDAIQQKDRSFQPEGLERWRRDNTKMYNEKTFSMISDLEILVREDVMQYLLGKYSEHWKLSIPKVVYQSIEKKASDLNYEIEDNQERIHPLSCLTLNECREIILYGKHWSEQFEKTYTKPSEARKKAGTKKKKTEWMRKLNDIKKRQNTFGYSVTEENFEMIKAIYQWLTKK